MIRKIKELLLDPKYQESNIPVSSQRDNRRSQRGENQRHGNRKQTQNRMNRTKKTKQRTNRLMELVLLGFLFVVAGVILFGNNRPDAIAIDPVSLCPINNEHITRKTYILIDLSEPLGEIQLSNLKELLEKTADNMKTRELLSISQMQTLQYAPRKEVQRFCSPDVSRIGQAGTRIQTDDCDAINGGKFGWNPNIGKAVRKNISTACKHYLKRKSKAKDAAELYKKVDVEQQQSYIVGSIEDAMVDANNEPSNVPARLIVFSDMLQNAGWFSQYRTQSSEWTIENLRERRKNAPIVGAPPDNNFNEVLLCYSPIDDPAILATSRQRKKHRQMWEDYFSESSSVKFNIEDKAEDGVPVPCLPIESDMTRKN